MKKRDVLLAAMLGLAIGACTAPPPRTGPATPAPDVAAPAAGKAALKSGEQVYREVCMACHDTGVAGAPKFGNGSDWEKLIAEGQVVVTAHGWVGVRAMPPRGGRPDLTQEEFARAVVWMARSAGADWQDPDAATLHAIHEEAENRREELEKKEHDDD